MLRGWPTPRSDGPTPGDVGGPDPGLGLLVIPPRRRPCPAAAMATTAAFALVAGCSAPVEVADPPAAATPDLLVPACPAAPPAARIVRAELDDGALRLLAADDASGPWDDLGLSVPPDALLRVELSWVLAITQGAQGEFVTIDAHGTPIGPTRILPPGVRLVDVDFVEGRTAVADGPGRAVVINCIGPGQEGLPTAHLGELLEPGVEGDLVSVVVLPDGVAAALHRTTDGAPGEGLLVHMSCEADVLGTGSVPGAPTLLHGAEPSEQTRVLLDSDGDLSLAHLGPTGDLEGPWHPLPEGVLTASAARGDGTAWLALDVGGRTDLLCAPPGGPAVAIARQIGDVAALSAASGRLAVGFGVNGAESLAIVDAAAGCDCAPDPGTAASLPPSTFVALPAIVSR